MVRATPCSVFVTTVRRNYGRLSPIPMNWVTRRSGLLTVMQFRHGMLERVGEPRHATMDIREVNLALAIAIALLLIALFR